MITNYIKFLSLLLKTKQRLAGLKMHTHTNLLSYSSGDQKFKIRAELPPVDLEENLLPDFLLSSRASFLAFFGS